jgi:histidine triad (HIT) family protein
MEDCLFCRIAQGTIPSYRIWENEHCLAILDIFPNSEGQVLVLSKEHHSSDPAEVPAKVLFKAFEASQEVMRKMKSVLGVYRVACVAEGMGINHLHIKLYPLHGVDATWRPHLSKTRVIVESYPGYITTELGPAAAPEELADLASRFQQS